MLDKHLFRTTDGTTHPLLRKIGVIAAVAVLVTVLIVAHLVSWYGYLTIVDNAKREGATEANLMLCLMLSDNLDNIYRDHAVALLAADLALSKDESVDELLTNLATRPGVKDAFLLNLENRTLKSLHHTISDTALLNKLDVRKGMGADSSFTTLRRTIGNATKIRRVTEGSNAWPVLVRYVGNQYPAYTKEVLGYVLDENWYIQQIAPRLDSLTRENKQMLWFYSTNKDTNALKPGERYATPDDESFQLTAGVLRGSYDVWETGGADTIWWYGDHKLPVKDWSNSFDRVGYIIGIDEFNITVGARTDYPAWTQIIGKRSRGVTRIFLFIELAGLTIIVLLFFSVRMIRRQSRRNQIALGHLAHSVKTPVARLQLAADILEGGQVSTPEEERKIIQTVSGECRQLRRAVENAALSLEGGKIAIHKESGDLAGLIRETTDAWKQSFDQAGIRLMVEGAEKPLQASFDRDKLRLALDNLIDNALRHTYLNMKNLKPGDAAVTTALCTEGKSIVLSVSDSGAGIPKADMKNVFKRFSRSGKDPLTGVSGLGLGLALVKEIAEGHGGKVGVEQIGGGGVKFIITLTSKESE